MTHFKLGTIVFAFLAVTAFVWASESDELREKAEVMQREAAELAEQVHEQEAVNLKRKAMAMLEEAERLQHGRLGERHPEIMKLKQALEQLRQDEKYLENFHGVPGMQEQLADVRRGAGQVEMKVTRGAAAVPNQPHNG